MVAETSECLLLQPQTGKQNTASDTRVEALKTRPSDIFPPARLSLLSLPQTEPLTVIRMPEALQWEGAFSFIPPQYSHRRPVAALLIRAKTEPKFVLSSLL